MSVSESDTGRDSSARTDTNFHPDDYLLLSHKVAIELKKCLENPDNAVSCGKCSEDLRGCPHRSKAYLTHLHSHLEDPSFVCQLCGDDYWNLKEHCDEDHEGSGSESIQSIKPEAIPKAVENLFECLPSFLWVAELFNVPPHLLPQTPTDLHDDGTTDETKNSGTSTKLRQLSEEEGEAAVEHYKTVTDRIRLAMTNHFQESAEPLSCQKCPYKLQQKKNIKGTIDHTRTHLPEKPFRCFFCHELYSDIRGHIARYHGDVKDLESGSKIDIRPEIALAAAENLFQCFSGLLSDIETEGVETQSTEGEEKPEKCEAEQEEVGSHTQLESAEKQMNQAQGHYNVIQNHILERKIKRDVTTGFAPSLSGPLDTNQQDETSQKVSEDSRSQVNSLLNRLISDEQNALNCIKCNQSVKGDSGNLKTYLVMHIQGHGTEPLYRCAECALDIRIPSQHKHIHHRNTSMPPEFYEIREGALDSVYALLSECFGTKLEQSSPSALAEPKALIDHLIRELERPEIGSTDAEVSKYDNSASEMETFENSNKDPLENPTDSNSEYEPMESSTENLDYREIFRATARTGIRDLKNETLKAIQCTKCDYRIEKPANVRHGFDHHWIHLKKRCPICGQSASSVKDHVFKEHVNSTSDSNGMHQEKVSGTIVDHLFECFPEYSHLKYYTEISDEPNSSPRQKRKSEEIQSPSEWFKDKIKALKTRVESGNLYCHACPKELSNLPQDSKMYLHFKRHIFDHSDEDPYSCSVCPNPVTYKSTTTHQQRYHKGQKMPPQFYLIRNEIASAMNSLIDVCFPPSEPLEQEDSDEM